MDIQETLKSALDWVRENVSPVPAGRARAIRAHGRVLSEDISRGDFSMARGTWLDADALSQIAAAGCLTEGMFLPAYQRMRIGLLLLENDVANGPVLEAALREMGFSAERLIRPPAGDADALADVLWMAAETTDLYIIVGDVDLLEDALPLLEADAPLALPALGAALAIYRRRPVLALPGEPAAAFAAFRNLAPALILRRAGC